MKKINIIGSGFSSLSAACYLAQSVHQVNVYEKNDHLGGRARQYTRQGFKFDMGPTWYWMPDVFDRFFSEFGKTTSDYYELERLDPGYRVYFDKGEYLDISADTEEIIRTFEGIEPGAGKRLREFLHKAKHNYRIAINDLVYKPGISPLELITKDTVLELRQFLSSVRDYVYRNFTDPRLRQILEFPALFLGAKPSDTPLFYSFMNYADFGLGTWYPHGGMNSVVEGMVNLALELGVVFHTQSPVDHIGVDSNSKVKNIYVHGQQIPSDIVVSGADYHHSEQLLAPQFRTYSNQFWQKKIMAPSSLLFYVGFSKKVENALHHTLFFDGLFDSHAIEIYDDPKWPEKPLFYASFPSQTDDTVAPSGCEAGVFLIPIAVDLEDAEEVREKYFKIILKRLEKLTGQELADSVLFKKSYCVKNFKDDYNSYRGNAYGMANILKQTAFMRPKIKSKKVENLFFTGQLTVPGPGVPPAIISGKLVSDLIQKENKVYYEKAV